MARLSAADYEQTLAFLHDAHDVDGPDPFPLHIVQRLRQLIPSAAVTYREWEGSRVNSVLAADDPDAFHRVWAEYSFVRHQDPFPGGPGPGPSARTSFGSAVMFTDVLAKRQLHRLELYHVLFRPLGLTDTMKLFLPMPHGQGATFVFDRERHNFTERDRLVLNTLAPHLLQLRKRLHRRNGGSLTRREREILEWVARGKTNSEIASILWVASGTVRKHLDNIYAKLGVSNRAEAVASLFR